QVNHLYALAFEEVIGIQQAQFMVLALRQKEHNFPVAGEVGDHTFDAYNQFLADDIGNQVFLGRMNIIGEPENADLVQKRKNQVTDGLVNTFCRNKLIEQSFKLLNVEVYHVLQ